MVAADAKNEKCPKSAVEPGIDGTKAPGCGVVMVDGRRGEYAEEVPMSCREGRGRGRRVMRVREVVQYGTSGAVGAGCGEC